MALRRDSGVVLRTYKLGEADRIVVLLTEHHGKVRAVAKGVRKTRSRFGSRLEPTSHVALQLYEGRNLDTITQAESIEHFRVLRDDLDRLGKAVTMLETVDHLALEGEPNSALYRMLLGALRALVREDAPLVLPAFLLKALSLEGFRPEVEQCALCGTSEALVAVDLEVGGVLCAEHRRGRAVSPEALEVLRAILGGRLGGALEMAASPVTREVDRLATELTEHHLERRLRSVTVLDRS